MVMIRSSCSVCCRGINTPPMSHAAGTTARPSPPSPRTHLPSRPLVRVHILRPQYQLQRGPAVDNAGPECGEHERHNDEPKLGRRALHLDAQHAATNGGFTRGAPEARWGRGRGRAQVPTAAAPPRRTRRV